MSLNRHTIINPINGNTSTTYDTQSSPIYFVSTHNTLIDANISGIQSTVNSLNAARPLPAPNSKKYALTNLCVSYSAFLFCRKVHNAN